MRLRAAPASSPPRPAAWSSRNSAPRSPAKRSHSRRDLSDRLLPVGGGVADVFLLRRRDRRKPALQRGDDLSRVSSTESVVWVTKARVSGSGTAQRHARRPRSRPAARRRRGAGPWCRRPPDGRNGRSARPAGPRRGGARPPDGPWRPAGRWRSTYEHVAPLRLGRDRLRHAVRREDDRCVGRHLVQLLDEDGALLSQGPRRHSGCGRSRAGRRPGRRTFASARSTIWIARSTPGAESARIGQQGRSAAAWRRQPSGRRWRRRPRKRRPLRQCGPLPTVPRWAEATRPSVLVTPDAMGRPPVTRKTPGAACAVRPSGSGRADPGWTRR